MNFKDSIKNSNSWHWLGCAVIASFVASYFVPSYGWRDVLQHVGRTLSAREKAANQDLEDVRALCAVDVAALESERRRTVEKTQKVRSDFARYGIEEMPVGDKAVFTAQSRVGEALSRRNLRIISTSAKVAEVQSAPVAVPKTTVAAATRETMSPEEIMARAKETAAQMTDRKMANMLIEDARKLAAKAREANLQKPVQKSEPRVQVPMERKSLPFKTDTLEYRVTGDFRDMFMFFVSETYKKPSYNFRGISVVRGEDGTTELSFVLQVNHK